MYLVGWTLSYLYWTFLTDHQLSLLWKQVCSQPLPGHYCYDWSAGRCISCCGHSDASQSEQKHSLSVRWTRIRHLHQAAQCLSHPPSGCCLLDRHCWISAENTLMWHFHLSLDQHLVEMARLKEKNKNCWFTIKKLLFLTFFSCLYQTSVSVAGLTYNL